MVDYSSQIASLQSQIAGMQQERAEILKKIQVLQKNVVVLGNAKAAVAKEAQSLNDIKDKATDDFIGNRRNHFDQKVVALKVSVQTWGDRTQDNIQTVQDKIASLTAEASNLAIGINYAGRTLSDYQSLQAAEIAKERKKK